MALKQSCSKHYDYSAAGVKRGEEQPGQVASINQILLLYTLANCSVTL